MQALDPTPGLFVAQITPRYGFNQAEALERLTEKFNWFFEKSLIQFEGQAEMPAEAACWRPSP